MGIIKKGYFLKILDSDKKLLALYSNDILLCKGCAEKVGCNSWNPDKEFVQKWLKPQLDGFIDDTFAWCDKCGETIWDSHKSQLFEESVRDEEVDGWLDELDEDDEWLDNLNNDSENSITFKTSPSKETE